MGNYDNRTIKKRKPCGEYKNRQTHQHREIPNEQRVLKKGFRYYMGCGWIMKSDLSEWLKRPFDKSDFVFENRNPFQNDVKKWNFRLKKPVL